MDQKKSGEEEYPEFFRASHLCICLICNKEYIKHPMDPNFTDWDGHPYLNVLCDGTKVKL